MLDQKKLAENIISLLGLQTLPDEKKLALLDKMSNLAQKRISLRILEQLNEAEQEAFVAATAASDEEKLKEILAAKKIDLAALVEEETVKLKDEMKSVVAGLGV